MAIYENDVKKLVEEYYKDIENLQIKAKKQNEGSVKAAFAKLLRRLAESQALTLIEEESEITKKNNTIRYDGVIKYTRVYPVGYWEAKDRDDNLEKEVLKKIKSGYKTENTIFENTKDLIYYRYGKREEKIELADRESLIKVLTRFITYEPQEIKSFNEALKDFTGKIQLISSGIKRELERLKDPNKSEYNKKFERKYNNFLKICQESINKYVSESDVDGIIAQHLLTGHILKNIFENQSFFDVNSIYQKVHSLVIDLFKDDYYKLSEIIAKNTKGILDEIRQKDHLVEKRKLLINFYEEFYKAYNPSKADKHGIIYTPKELSDFIINTASVLLSHHLSRKLYDDDVLILDPCTGTGNFIVGILEHTIERAFAKSLFEKNLFAIEVDILPYYIASLNIESSIYEKTKEYLPFKHLAFADTLNLVKLNQGNFFSEENTKLAKKIINKNFTLIIGNPPYNANQKSENENNKNYKYEEVDALISEKFVKTSNAQKSKAYDMYLKFLIWALEKVNDAGMVAFVTNRSYIDAFSMDGVRKTLEETFDFIYIVDLGGNIRTKKREDKNIENIFGIQTGVAVIFLIKKEKKNEKAEIYYFNVEEREISKNEKINWLKEKSKPKNYWDLTREIEFKAIIPDKNHNWLNINDNDFDSLIPLCSKKNKEPSIFKLFSNGIVTARDAWTYDFNKERLEKKIKHFIKVYEKKREEWNKLSENDKSEFIKDNYNKLPEFLKTKIKWTRELKERDFLKNKTIKFKREKITLALYRPFVKKYCYFDKEHRITHEPYRNAEIWGERAEKTNISICFSGIGSTEFDTMLINKIPCYDLLSKTQQLPLYIYKKAEAKLGGVRVSESEERVENITDWALEKFREHYKDLKIQKKDIFYYSFGVLNSKKYKKTYEMNLKNNFPRIPFYEDFWKYKDFGEALSFLELNFAKCEELPLSLEREENKLKQREFKIVENVVYLSQGAKLGPLPNEALEYKIAGKSPIEHLLSQYKKAFEQKISQKEGEDLELFSTLSFEDEREEIVRNIKKLATLSIKILDVFREFNL